MWSCPVRACTLAVNSATVNPLGAGACARAARSVTHAGFVQVDTADPGGAQPDAGGQLIDAVAEEYGVHTVQAGGEPVDHASQFGHDLGKLRDHPAAAQLRGVVRDRLEPQHAFAFGVRLAGQPPEVQLEHGQVKRRCLDRGKVTTTDGQAVAGPDTRWIGRRHGRRQHRRWATSWSPEQIAHRLRIDFPDDESMRVSHEAIYQALYVQGRGALRRELCACLRTGRALRVPRARTRERGKRFVTPEIMISERPAEAEDRAVPGHWEGDLMLGLGSSAIGTLVERTTRFTMLLHLPRMPEHGQPRVKNGPALAGHGAEAVPDAIAKSITTLPEQLRRSLTWDQGAEMAQHARLRVEIGLPIYFCDPHSPWQRGSNENTNGFLRQYFPKGTDLAKHSTNDLDAVAAALNSRPRKTLGWKTPAEALNDYLLGDTENEYQ